MLRIRWISASLFLMMVLSLLAACGGNTPPAAEAPTTAPTAAPANAPATDATPAEAAPAETSGGVVTIGIGGAPDSLNPGVAYLAEAFDLFDLVYDTALDLDLHGEYHPSLVESHTASEDGKTWTLKVRSDAKWHDGQPLTAEDIAFTYQSLIDLEEFAFIKAYTTHFESATAVDPTTVELKLSSPVGNMDFRLAAIYILPKHIWQPVVEGNTVSDFENLEMIGTGPFSMDEYQQGTFTVLKANREHFASPPKVDEVIFKTYANPDALVQALRAGEVDMIGELPFTTIATLRNEPTITVVSGGARDLRDIFFNVVEPENCPPDDGKCTGHPALRDVQVRRALAHATDKQQMIDVSYLGMATPGLSIVPIGLGEWFNSELEDYAYDPERAKQILEEAGYVDSDGDGVREMPGDPSTPLRFRFHIPSDILTGAREGEMLSSMWREIGIEIEVQILEPDTVTSICCPAFDFDVILWGWSSGADPDLLSILTTGEIPTGMSETGYSNPEYDELFVQQETEVDQEKRKEIIWKMQEIAVRDVPYIIPYYQQTVQAYRNDRFQGWVADENAILYLPDRTSLTVITPVK